MSKYIDFGTMTLSEFAKSPPGTVAKFFLVSGSKARAEIGKSLKSVCSRQGRKCRIESKTVLIDNGDETWSTSRVVTAEVI